MASRRQRSEGKVRGDEFVPSYQGRERYPGGHQTSFRQESPWPNQGLAGYQGIGNTYGQQFQPQQYGSGGSGPMDSTGFSQMQYPVSQYPNQAMQEQAHQQIVQQQVNQYQFQQPNPQPQYQQQQHQMQSMMQHHQDTPQMQYHQQSQPQNYQQQAAQPQYQQTGSFHDRHGPDYGSEGHDVKFSQYSMEQDHGRESFGYGEHQGRQVVLGEDEQSRNAPSSVFDRLQGTAYQAPKDERYHDRGKDSSKKYGDRDEMLQHGSQSPRKGRDSQHTRNRSSNPTHNVHQDSTRHIEEEDRKQLSNYGKPSRMSDSLRHHDKPSEGKQELFTNKRIVEVYNPREEDGGLSRSTGKSSRYAKSDDARKESSRYDDSYVEGREESSFVEPMQSSRRVELYEKGKPSTREEPGRQSGHKRPHEGDNSAMYEEPGRQAVYKQPYGAESRVYEESLRQGNESSRYTDFDERNPNRQQGSSFGRATNQSEELIRFEKPTGGHYEMLDVSHKRPRTDEVPQYQMQEERRLDDRLQPRGDFPISDHLPAQGMEPPLSQVEIIKKQIEDIQKSLSAEYSSMAAASQLSTIKDMLSTIQAQVGSQSSQADVRYLQRGPDHGDAGQRSLDEGVAYQGMRQLDQQQYSEIDTVPLSEPGRELEAALSMRKIIEDRMSENIDQTLAVKYREIYKGLSQQIDQMESQNRYGGRSPPKRMQTSTKAVDYGQGDSFGIQDKGHGDSFGRQDKGRSDSFGKHDQGHGDSFGRQDKGHRDSLGRQDKRRGDSFGRQDQGHDDSFSRQGKGHDDSFSRQDRGHSGSYGRQDKHKSQLYPEDSSRARDYTASFPSNVPDKTSKVSESRHLTDRTSSSKSGTRGKDSTHSESRQAAASSTKEKKKSSSGRESRGSRRRRRTRSTTSEQQGVLCYVCDVNFDNVSTYVEHLQGSEHERKQNRSKSPKKKSEEGTASRETTDAATATHVSDKPSTETVSGQLSDDLVLPFLTIEERLRSIFNFQDDDRFCLICNQLVSKNVTLTVHCGRQRHQIMQALLDEIAQLNYIIEDFAKPDKIQDALRRAEKIEDKLNQAKTMPESNAFCPICSVHVKHVESQSLEPHLTGVRHERVKQMCEVIVMVKTAIENNSLKKIDMQVEDYERMLRYRPSDQKKWLCLICDVMNTNKPRDQAHFETSHHITKKICITTILQSLKMVLNARTMLPIRQESSHRSSRGHRSSADKGQSSHGQMEPEVGHQQGGYVYEGISDMEREFTEEELDYDESMLVAYDEIGTELYEYEEDPNLYQKPDSYQASAVRQEERAPSRDRSDRRQRDDRSDRRQRDDRSDRRQRDDRSDRRQRDDKRKEKRGERHSRSQTKTNREEDFSKGYTGDIVGKSFVKPGFYCTLCNQYYGDAEVAFNKHCTTRAHCKRVRFLNEEGKSHHRQRPR
ncbi:filaggrin-like [Ptychodera flava]|uniref:filaggrin-like n=1 Tax=Ptychodera flava TaxID=63121 RepID=UPI00396A774A